MTPEQEYALLAATQMGLDDLLREAYRRLVALIGAGVPPRDAVQQTMQDFPDEYAGLLAQGFSAILERSVGSESALAMEVSGVRLSSRLYAEAAQTSAVVTGIVNRHARGFQDARRLTLDLFEGYGFRDGETLNLSPKNKKLPKYLREALLSDPGLAGELKRHFARVQATNLKTPALRAAYLQALDAIEQSSGRMALERKLQVAFFERMRYFANRIAQTELHRVYVDRQARELMDDPDVDYVQWRLSGTHPKTDICDMFASVDKYGLGPGVYPKVKAPKPPAHPFCRCILAPRLDLTGKKARERSGAEREWLRQQGVAEAARVVGSRANLEAVRKGADPLAVWNAGRDPLYHVRMVADAPYPASVPQRAPWRGDEVAQIVAGESAVKQHPLYAEAKAGGTVAAARLVMDIINDDWIARHGQEIQKNGPTLVGVHAVEGMSTNKIGTMMAQWLALRLDLPLDDNLVQINRVGHTGASGWHRLSHPALFAGEVEAGRAYWLLDDFVGQGGTFANLRGYIEAKGGRVVGMTALTGRADSAKIGLSAATLAALRAKHGNLEDWWRQRFGYGFDYLTESEARYLLRAEDADTIRNRLAAAG